MIAALLHGAGLTHDIFQNYFLFISLYEAVAEMHSSERSVRISCL